MSAPFGRRTVDVIERRSAGPYTLITLADPGAAAPQPGQFYMLAARRGWGGGDDERPFLPRALSVMRAREQRLEFLLEDVGPGTHRLCALQAGEEVWLTGPLGTGFSEHEGRRPVLAGGGVGIAPLALWQDRLRSAGRAHALLLGFRDGAHAAGADLLHEAVVCTDDGSRGHHGPVTVALAAALGEDDVVYACGPPGMLEAVRALCAERGVPCELALEAAMACGFGACYGCVVPTREGYARVCVDGPVMDGERLLSALAP